MVMLVKIVCWKSCRNSTSTPLREGCGLQSTKSLPWVLLVLLFGSSVMLAVTGCDDRVVLVSCCTTTVWICCLKTLRVPPDLVWEHSRSSLLFAAVPFIFRRAVAVLPQIYAYLWKDNSIYCIHTHKLWAKAQTEAVRFGKWWQHCFLWERCKKWHTQTPARVFILYSWLDAFI